jgi:hypothetical protein
MTGLALPAPPVPADADLRHFDDMPLEVRRLRDSGIVGVANGEIFRCAVLLWCVSWHQLPAGSLPQADADLCRLVGLGRDLKTWSKLKDGILRGWELFADGRLYHPVVAEKVIEGWNSTRLKRWANECDRIRKENKARGERQEAPLETPSKPKPIPMEWPAKANPVSGGNEGNSGGTPVSPPLEKGLNRKEGNEIEVIKKDVPIGTSGDGPPAGGAMVLANLGSGALALAGDRAAIEQQAFDAWQEAAGRVGRWPKLRKLDPDRRAAVRGRIADAGGIGPFLAVLAKAEGSRWIREDMNAFGFDWFMKLANFRKVAEGNYDDDKQGSPGRGTPARGGVATTMSVVADLQRREQQHGN